MAPPDTALYTRTAFPLFQIFSQKTKHSSSSTVSPVLVNVIMSALEDVTAQVTGVVESAVTAVTTKNVDWSSAAALAFGILLAVGVLMLLKATIKWTCARCCPCCGVLIDDPLLANGSTLSDGKKKGGKPGQRSVTAGQRSPPKRPPARR
jgi:hypothetical protein